MASNVGTEERHMVTLPIGPISKPWIKAISNWWSNYTKRRHRLHESSELKCFAEEEIDRIANEAGVSAAEIHDLVKHSPEAPNLLFRRMTALNLDRDEVSRIDPSIFEELKTNCALCDSRRRCIRDLARDASDPVWEEYCPNAGTLQALNALPWMSRRESEAGNKQPPLDGK